MSLRQVLMLCMGMAVASTSAIAFQEQQGAPATAPAKPAAEQKDMNLNVPPPAAKPEGTEVNIPGLGKLGVLPKMDFGLELLYGANEAPKAAEPATPAERQPEEDDLTIRGSIKKSF